MCTAYCQVVQKEKLTNEHVYLRICMCIFGQMIDMIERLTNIWMDRWIDRWTETGAEAEGRRERIRILEYSWSRVSRNSFATLACTVNLKLCQIKN